MKEINKNKSKQRTITVEAQPVSTAIVPQEKQKRIIPKGLRPNPLGSNGNVHRGRAKSALDIALENFLMEEVVPNGRAKKHKTKKQIAREPRMRALVKAVYMQAIQGLGKGKLAELIFERVGGKPMQDIYSEELVARFEDPVLRKQRIKELQKTLKTRITT